MKLNQALSKNPRPSGFTLLEMVIVMVIMGILAGGVIALIGNVQDNARAERADQDMARFATYLDLYRSRAKLYPTTEQGLEALVKKPSNGPVPRKWQSQIKELPTDPWGQPYRYTNTNGRSFVIACNGSDQEPGTDDDIVYDSK